MRRTMLGLDGLAAEAAARKRERGKKKERRRERERGRRDFMGPERVGDHAPQPGR
jgi:hypothetical protein